MPPLKVAGIIPESITDGPGIRAAVFVQGCPHHCPGCHNPESHPFDGGEVQDTEALFCRIAANPLLSGITLSGGEPMCQAAALCDVAARARAAGLEVAVYTGYTWEELVRENDPDRMRLLSLADVLVDGRFELAERSLELLFRGSRNQRILDVKRSFAEGRAVPMTDGRWNRPEEG